MRDDRCIQLYPPAKEDPVCFKHFFVFIIFIIVIRRLGVLLTYGRLIIVIIDPLSAYHNVDST